MSTKSLVCATCLLTGFLWLSPAYAGQAVSSGREAGFWTEWHRALVVARVRTEAVHVEGAESKFYMHMAIEPLATLAGTFDPSGHASQDIQFYVGTPTIPNAPGEGEYIMIVLEDGNFIISDECDFMPRGLPLVAIDGLSDPRVHDTLKKVRDARAHPIQG